MSKLKNVVLSAVANGYVVRPSEYDLRNLIPNESIFAFESFEAMACWLKDNMVPLQDEEDTE